MFRKSTLVLLALVAGAASLAAQSKPNFSGTWTLNVAKSDFGMIPAPSSRTDVVEHNDPTIKVTSSQEGQQGKRTDVSNFTTDGKESTNKMGPMDAKSTMTWQGSNLVQNVKLDFQGQDVNIKTTWSLSEDGKTLSMNGHVASPMGEFDTKMIFDKGDGAAATASAAPAAKAATPTAGGAKSNYSGTWKVNVAKSDYGVLPAPSSRTDIIDHKDPVLKVTTSEDGANGKQDYTLAITTDGKEATNTPGGLELKNTANWEGSNLIVGTKLKFQDNDVAIKATWELSPDGKVLTQSSHYTTAMGEFDTKVVYEKQ